MTTQISLKSGKPPSDGAAEAKAVRQQRVMAIATAVKAGTYWIPGDQIAARMLEYYTVIRVH